MMTTYLNTVTSAILWAVLLGPSWMIRPSCDCQVAPCSHDPIHLQCGPCPHFSAFPSLALGSHPAGLAFSCAETPEGKSMSLGYLQLSDLLQRYCRGLGHQEGMLQKLSGAGGGPLSR